MNGFVLSENCTVDIESRMFKSMGSLGTKSESRETDFVPDFLDIVLNLISILSERKFPINRGFLSTSDERIVRWAEEVCNGVSLLLHIGNHFVFHTFVHVIAPCLQR